MRKALQAVLALALLAPLAVTAQGYPNRPVKIINPFTPGGPIDLIARELINGWSKALGQTFVLESKPGASGGLAISYVAHAAPDGYTLLIGSAANITVPALSTKPPFDGIKEFSPVVLAIFVPNIMTVGPHVRATNVQQYIELAKAKPGRLSFGSAGHGGSTHIAGEIFQQEAKVKLTHVPYKGAAPVINDMLGGHVDTAFLNLSAVLPHIKSGRLRALGVASNARSKMVPDVPTFAELGVQHFFSGSWYGVLAPAGTPPEIVHALYTASANHLLQPEVRLRIEESGAEVFLLDPPKLLAFMLEQKRDLVKIIKATGITKIDQ